jgi:hypothetical protein
VSESRTRTVEHKRPPLASRLHREEPAGAEVDNADPTEDGRLHVAAASDLVAAATSRRSAQQRQLRVASTDLRGPDPKRRNVGLICP